MKTLPTHEQQVQAFPPVLQKLIRDELAAGNSIVEIASSFPAPPAGGYVKLAEAVKSRVHEGEGALTYYNRNSTLYSGEWTDAKRFYFVLEPARPYEPPAPPAAAKATPPPPAAETAEPGPGKRGTGGDPSILPLNFFTAAQRGPEGSALRRFLDSMAIDYEKWHDGIGYDLDAIAAASAKERKKIEDVLVPRAGEDWRDVEALAALGTERANEALKQALKTGSADIKAAILEHAPHLADARSKTASLIEAIKEADAYAGLDSTLRQVEKHHPPAVIDALLEATLTGSAVAACHYAGMLLYLHDKAEEAFDWDHRPFLLKFSTDDKKARQEPYKELLKRIGR